MNWRGYFVAVKGSAFSYRIYLSAKVGDPDSETKSAKLLWLLPSIDTSIKASLLSQLLLIQDGTMQLVYTSLKYYTGKSL